ncbi:MAG: hypothetical protein ABIR56_09250 [Polaromonas sp.]
MPSGQRTGHNTAPGVESMRAQWLQVCRARGTPAPDPARVAPFLAGLDAQAHDALAQALVLCLKGQEKRRELEVLSWAAGCTRPALLAQLLAQGILCTGHDLFGVGLGLMASGWDMSARLAQLAQHPQDVAFLREALARQAPTSSPAFEAQALPTRADAAAPVDPDRGTAPDGDRGSAPPPEPSERSGPFVPARHARTDHPEPASATERLQVKLFGSQAAHTLEIGPHRRSSSFMGVQVVTIESAHALGSGGYDWGQKLTVQLTPEEMPEAIAVLMNLCPSVRFGQHGASRDKFVELRRQEGGMVLVTAQGSAVYAVPVKTAALYYLLGLFARAMAQGLPGSSVAEVLELVKASQ